MPIMHNKIFFGEDYSTTKVLGKKNCLKGIFVFQIFLLLSTGKSDWRIALYNESTEKPPWAYRSQPNTSGPGE
jgi:hypothetical protein